MNFVWRLIRATLNKMRAAMFRMPIVTGRTYRRMRREQDELIRAVHSGRRII